MPYSKRKKIIYEMNVIPYIDVMLVLLLVFMIAAPLMYQGLEVNLPETTSKEINLNNFKEPLIIDVNENKKIFSTGKIIGGNWSGALMGGDSYGTVINSFWDVNSSSF